MKSRVLLLLLVWLLSGCFGSPNQEGDTNANNNTGGGGSNGLSLSGAPGNGQQDLYYYFNPGISNPSGGTLSFSLSGLPSWASANASTGGFSGYPDKAGTTSSVSISATSGSESAVLSPLSFTIFGDPLREESWHLINTGQKAFASNGGTAGFDLGVKNVWRSGIVGRGVRVAMSDSGLEIAHEDLAENVIAGASRDYKTSAPYTGDPSPDPNTNDGDHGTCVAGIIGARGWNGLGSRGVAPAVGLAGLNYLSDDVTQTVAKLVDQADGDFDIFNQSWGSDVEGDEPLSTSYQNQLAWASSNLRSGRGALYVKAAGNSFRPSSSYPWMTSDANSDPFNTSPYLVVVGALNASGVKASYSSIGSCLWVSGLGGEFGTTQPAIITTDRMGCSKGFSTSSATANAFEKGQTSNNSCNYTSTFNGTSAATPSVSGVIALMLEANPSLTWREVKHILAVTAKKVDASFAPIANRAVDSAGYTWEPGWITNAAGFHFHNYYGFGLVDAESAVMTARSWSHYFKTFSTASVDSGTISLTIPDDNASGVTSTLSFSNNWVIESVVVQVSATHPYTGDLGIELTSPSGTKSILFHANNAFVDDTDLSSMRLLSNAFYGESSAGTWTLRVLDAAPGETGTRTLTNWRLNVYGRVGP